MTQKITLYGAGYVGLVTGVCFAELGNDVLIIDIQQDKINRLLQGQSPIYEPGLEALLQKNLSAGRLNFSNDLQQGVAHGLFQFIAVGTPSNARGEVDLQYVYNVAATIAEHITDDKIIINKSTVAVGTTDKLSTFIDNKIAERDLQIKCAVLSNPEFLKQGAAIADFMYPDRIIIGGEDQPAIDQLCSLYAPISKDGQSIIQMNSVSAELTKYAANAYLATRISFINEMSQIAERLNADIDMVRCGLSADKRIGAHFLFAGCGFGGSCFPKDVRALTMMADAVDYQPHLLHAVEVINKQQKEILFHKISAYFNHDLSQKTLALWGLSFKPDTDDMREAPSRVLIDALLTSGARIKAYDPAAMHIAAMLYANSPHLSFCPTAYGALDDADALVVITEWKQFTHPDFAIIQEKLTAPVIFDGRNIYDPILLARLGFKYYGIGRGDK